MCTHFVRRVQRLYLHGEITRTFNTTVVPQIFRFHNTLYCNTPQRNWECIHRASCDHHLHFGVGTGCNKICASLPQGPTSVELCFRQRTAMKIPTAIVRVKWATMTAQSATGSIFNKLVVVVVFYRSKYKRFISVLCKTAFCLVHM